MKHRFELLLQKFIRLRAWQKVLALIVFTLSLHWLYLLLLIVVYPPITTTQIGSLIDGYGIKRNYVSFCNISPMAPLAVIAAEDQLFMGHFGLDLNSIEKAMEHNKLKKKRKRGASTISQQVAKNIFLWQGRSWLRKGLEVYFTFMIEGLWSKKRIIEMYLNTVEMGEGVFGIEAAARQYFGKSARFLTREEAAMIAASLPNPKRYKVKPTSAWVSLRKPWVLQQMSQLESDEEVRELLSKAYHKK
ncbi:MAG: monofunctional biosynthetic peptidoglycan transglycosylase [Saprospiraceae bacterium]|nr:monofunctional biosynthetic peptidoglycan transglycosylase [Saprospiraceae bacterium]MCC6842465.1 monofunctional biosynthetic peptidoglycan transglycosylase [Saprospiraceae bacterium]HRG32223.1 monofunctional biosynthetic peptidoglycan transglycosylase [Saprospiraceae bacterium]